MRTISDHILDIVQNSVRAGASLIEIIVREEINRDLYTLEIRDNGRGMTPDQVQIAMEPFFTTRTTRKVGLGLPLLRQNAEMTGGTLRIISEPGAGTTVTAAFGLRHIDRPSGGDIAGVFILCAGGHADRDFVYTHITASGSFKIDTRELKETLEGVPLNNKEIREAVREMIENNLKDIQIS